MQPHICEECRQLCELLQSKARPESAEWYCGACHKSYPVEGVTR